MGILSDRKYQNDGGPSLVDVYNLVKNNTTIPITETRKFIQYAIFNLVIGNCDAHGKNYSLVFRDKKVQLAPIYDTVSTIIYPNLTRKVSMKFGKHYEFKKINREDLELLASQLALKPKTILSCYDEIIAKLSDAFNMIKEDPSLKAHSATIELIEKNILRI